MQADPTRRRRPVLVLATVVVVVGTLVAYDLVTVGRQHRAQGLVQATRHQAALDRHVLATDRAQIAATTATLEATRAAERQTATETLSARQRLTGASEAIGLDDLDIATLDTCLGGVSTAVASSSAGDLQGAVDAITSASTACRALDGTGAGLAYPFDFPDPFVLDVGGEYYAFATNSAAGNIQIIRSSDLTDWTTVGDALPHLAPWARPGATWGPSVLQRGNTWVLYYSAVAGSTGEQCLSAAVATQPEGPYVDNSAWPIACQLDQGGSLDPSPFVAADGTPYLTWKSQGAGGQPPALWAQQLTPDGTALVPGPASELLTPSQAWQGGIVEGPDMVLSGGQYLLFYSANAWQTADYAIGVATCAGPLGPCTQAAGPPLLASQAGLSGPGGPSVFTDDTGSLWLAFHAWLPGRVGPPNSRDLFLRRITVTAGAVSLTP